MLYIITEPIYKESVWCKEITEGIVNRAKEKRIEYTFLTSIDRSVSGQVIVVATSLDFITNTCKVLETYPVKTVVATPKTEMVKCADCSFVGFDSQNAIFDLIKLLNQNGKQNVSLFGVNESSVNDLLKKQNFLSTGAKIENVFYNNGNIKKCFDSFFKVINNIDAVLCTNSYAAFYLVKKLKDINFSIGNLDIISLSNSKILNLINPKISAVGTDYYSIGKVAYDTVRILAKNDSLKNLNASVKWELKLRETTGAFDKTKIDVFNNEGFNTAGDFYVDGELLPVMKVERLFDGMDKNDLEILRLLKSGKKQEDISESLFMSESGVKYRLKRMLTLSDTSSKAELVDLISKLDIEI